MKATAAILAEPDEGAAVTPSSADGARGSAVPEAGQPSEVAALLSAINTKLDVLLRERRPGTKAKRFLSMREAARQLGISRDKALHDLIVSKRIRTVQVNGVTKIPASEIERIAQFGTDR